MKRNQVNKNLENWINQAFVNHGNRGSKMAIVLNSKLQVMKVLGDRFWIKMETTKYRLQRKICFCLRKYLMLPKTFPTLFLSSLDLFIGQASSWTCSGRALQVERVGGKLGKTASERGGDWFSRTRDGRHRVWRSACHGCWRLGMLVTAVLEQGCFSSHLLSFDNNKVLKVINWIC